MWHILGPQLITKMGASINKNMSLVDTESDGTNIVNVASNDPNKKYAYRIQIKNRISRLTRRIFSQESTLLNNPPSELRGLAKNRFYQLYTNIHKNLLLNHFLELVLIHNEIIWTMNYF